MAAPAGIASASRAIRVCDSPAARVRLFCLPYAGGGASVFRPWTNLLPPAIQVCPVQLPGREERLREPPYTSLTAAVDDLIPELLPLVDRTFALFGHSMGGAVAFELARELRRRGSSPAWLFVGASRAPHRQAATPKLSALSDPLLVETVQQKYGGIPEAIRRTPELTDLLVPVLRADLSVLDSYRYCAEPPLPCPISSFGGVDDRAIPQDDLLAWREHTAGSFEFQLLPGTHFFVKDSRAELLTAIKQRLQSVQ